MSNSWQINAKIKLSARECMEEISHGQQKLLVTLTAYGEIANPRSGAIPNNAAGCRRNVACQPAAATKMSTTRGADDEFAKTRL